MKAPVKGHGRGMEFYFVDERAAYPGGETKGGT